jgi:hypothetical protein
LPLRHLLGPSAASPSEIASIAAKLGPGAIQLLVKNYINENGYKEWESDPRFAETLQDRAAVLTIPRLEAEVCTSVQRAGVAFGAHITQSSSRIQAGYACTWLREVFAAFVGAGIDDLIRQAKG